MVTAAQSLAGGRPTIQLICTLDYTLDGENAERSEASGEELLTVRSAPDGRAVLKLQGLGAEFVRTVTEDEIVGETEYFVGGIHVRQEIVVNRATGSYRRILEVADGAGLFHFGDCRRLTEPKS